MKGTKHQRTERREIKRVVIKVKNQVRNRKITEVEN